MSRGSSPRQQPWAFLSTRVHSLGMPKSKKDWVSE